MRCDIRWAVTTATVLAAWLTCGRCGADSVIVSIDRVPPSHIAVARVDLTGAAAWCKAGPVAAEGVAGRLLSTGKTVPLQFIPAVDFDPVRRAVGTLVVKLPSREPAQVRLAFNPGEKPSGAWDGVVATPSFVIQHDPRKLGGQPCRVLFPNTGKTFDPQWQNRLHHQKQGSFLLANDPQPTAELVATGPVCYTVRVRARYMQPGQSNKWPPSKPDAVYDWHYFYHVPLVLVEATIRQAEPFQWDEVHFLEMDYPKEVFPHWAGGEPTKTGTFTGTRESFQHTRWGVVHDGRNEVGMFDGGQILLYDGGPGTYIQARGDEVWSPWNGTLRTFSAWMSLGSQGDPAKLVEAGSKETPSTALVSVGIDAVTARLDAAAKAAERLPANERRAAVARLRMARQRASQGRFAEAVAALDVSKPLPGCVVAAGDLNLVIEQTGDGIRTADLYDAALDRRLAAPQPAPLVSVKLRNAQSNEEVTVTTDSGWRHTEIGEPTAGGSRVLRLRTPVDKRLGDLGIQLTARPDAAAGAIRWGLAIDPPAAPWAVWRVVFPGVAVADMGPRGAVFFPQAAGIVRRDAWQQAFRFTGTYPSGWTTMQYLAAYDESARTGLYVGMHDPWGGTKDVIVDARPSQRDVLLTFDQPVPDMGKPGTRFQLEGEAVWQLLRGDWFDAAVIYRDWVRRHARWYPKLGPEGRADTPRWMRELAVWGQDGREPNECVAGMLEFTKYLDPPTAVHWYNWHQIPFDNDYPHYFPTKPGFVDGVKRLQAAGSHVMPYINGRLWDTHDRGATDFEFTKVARPAVSKNEKGEPYIESYGSKESDGSPVRLGVMCPSTALWQKRVRQIVLRLMNECGVHGVYIDQIAAAAPTLCFDPSHGHPLGGGHWWTEGYWKLLADLRSAMPADRMITTECNGEPYIRWFDGYLTWHWQYDGQVPAFPAVYGGAVAMFGRSYGGGTTKDLALRMRAGEQLVFGEQLGWLSPTVVGEKDNAEFFRQMVRLRRRLTPYFSAGEMARLPRLEGNVPTVRADWQWGGVQWVTTDAVRVAAWHRPAARRIALIAVNVDRQPVRAALCYDLRPYGATADKLIIHELTATGPATTTTAGPQLRRDVVFPGLSAFAWEIELGP